LPSQRRRVTKSNPHRSRSGSATPLFVELMLELISFQITVQAGTPDAQHLRGPQAIPHAHRQHSLNMHFRISSSESGRHSAPSAVVPIRRRNQSHIHVPHFRRAHPLHFAVGSATNSFPVPVGPTNNTLV
jgi:hypothetical protein